MAINFPADPAAQTPANTFSPTSTPVANTENSLTFVWNGSVWNSTTGGGGGVDSIIAGAGIAVDQPTGDVTVTNTGGGGGVGSLQEVCDVGNTTTTGITAAGPIIVNNDRELSFQTDSTGGYIDSETKLVIRTDGTTPRAVFPQAGGLLIGGSQLVTGSQTGNIELEDSGNITAAGNFTFNNATGTNAYTMWNGASSTALSFYDSDSTKTIARISTDGLYVGTNADTPSGQLIKLKTDGSVTCADTVIGNSQNVATTIGGDFRSNDADAGYPAVQARQFTAGGTVFQGRNSAGSPTFSVFDSGSATFAGDIQSSGNIKGVELEGVRVYGNGTGSPVTINSTNSNAYKIRFDDEGTTRGFIGGGDGIAFKVGNSSATNLIDVKDNGDIEAIGTYDGTSATLSGNVFANGYVYGKANGSFGNNSSVSSSYAIEARSNEKTGGIWVDIDRGNATYGIFSSIKNGTQAQYAIYGFPTTSSTYASAGGLFYSINSNTYSIAGYWSGSAYWGIYSNGQIGGTGFPNTSDERLKNISGRVENVLDKLDSINTYYYTWKDNTQSGRSADGSTNIGVSAQEVQAQFPEVVITNKAQKVNGENPTTMEEELGETLSVDYGKLSSILIQAIKELKTKVEDLEAQLAEKKK